MQKLHLLIFASVFTFFIAFIGINTPLPFAAFRLRCDNYCICTQL